LIDLRPLVKGFISFEIDFFSGKKKLVYFSDDLSQQKVIQEWEDKIDLDEKHLLDYEPAKDFDMMEVSFDRERIFLYKVGSQNIIEISARSKQIERIIEIPGEPIKYNTTWGRTRVESYSSRSQYTRQDKNPKFPEFFPFIRFIRATYDNKLLVRKWGINPDKVSSKDFLLFSPSGKSLLPRFMDLNTNRIKGRLGDKILVSRKGPNDEEFALCVVDEGELESFIKNNPIVRDNQAVLK